MKAVVHDVGHGGCVVFSLPNGARLMIDCGMRTEAPWRPSQAYAGLPIDLLVLSNLDEDHVADLPRVLTELPVKAVFTNPTVYSADLWQMKQEHGMRAGVQAAYRHLKSYGPGHSGAYVDLGDAEVRFFYVCYNPTNQPALKTTNNLSVVTYIGWRGFGMLVGGDLETAGWNVLLGLPAFRACLRSVNIFVASHHGRENGKCVALFESMHPEVVIFSDGTKQHSTQNTTAWYKYRACGIPVSPSSLGQPVQRRWVYTTRADGSLHIDVQEQGNWFLTAFPSRPAIPSYPVWNALQGLS